MADEKVVEETAVEEVKEKAKTPAYKLKAIYKYNKNVTKGYTFRLNKRTDAELIAFVESLDNKCGTFKELFTAEMNRRKKEQENE